MGNINCGSTVLGTTLAIATLSSMGSYYYWYHYWYYSFHNYSRYCTQQRRTPESVEKNETIVAPPFPQPLRELLSRCRLACIINTRHYQQYNHNNQNISTTRAGREATTDGSRLCLITRFTYVHDPDNDGEVVVIGSCSSFGTTKPLDDLLSRPPESVALLIHTAASDRDYKNDNQNGKRSSARTRTSSSIVLHGSCRIPTSADLVRYRSAHRKNNPGKEDADILCIDVTSARIRDGTSDSDNDNHRAAPVVAGTTSRETSDPERVAVVAVETGVVRVCWAARICNLRDTITKWRSVEDVVADIPPKEVVARSVLQGMARVVARVVRL